LKSILSSNQIGLTIQRLANQILENHIHFSNTVIIGLQPRGIYLSNKIVTSLEQLIQLQVPYGKLDITFYRDDFKKQIHVANTTNIPFSIEGKKVVLIDDVLWTGRTIRAALDALMDFGRPSKVELCVLIDRRFNRELPIQADYVGRPIDTLISEKVKVFWQEAGAEKDEVILIEAS
jgi:pyrimidine operon attenuation protein/uracil phosphoribosyltransferase